ncbi:UNVERIFIED_CONTAM: hypothetical protein GTU68_017364 [Idotea baltica]|nr:hypothetical protein [Idotea baltica]
MASYAKKASDAGAQLLLFPEASLTGYNNSLKVTQSIAQNAFGDAAGEIADICRSNNLAIAYGFAEKDGSKTYNSVQLIDANGDARSLYRKTHLWGDQDRTLFTPGGDLVAVIELNGWQIGMLICYDIEFPENVRRLSLEGADLILTPTALMSPWTTVANKVVPVRAYENQVFIAYANFCGYEYEQQYVGHSCIVGPDGVDLAKAAEDEVMLIATLDKPQIAQCRAALPYHRDRRPSLYGALSHDK